jgi:hypothetical protein
MMSEHPETHLAIAEIVQTFIETIGIPTIQHWTRAGKKHGWSLSQSGHRNQGFTTCPLIPTPVSGTLHYQFYGCPYGSLTKSISSDHSLTRGDLVSHTEPTGSQESDNMYDLEPISQTTLNLADSLKEISKLKAELEGAGYREDSLIAQIHTLFSHLQEKDKELAFVQAQQAAQAPSNSFSPSLSSISYVSSLRAQTPEPHSPTKKDLQNDLALKFPKIDTAQFPNSSCSPKHSIKCTQPFGPSSPFTKSASRDASSGSPTLLFAPPPTPTTSHGHNCGHEQAQGVSIGPYANEFLHEHVLHEKISDHILLIYNTPLPAWFKLIKSLDLTDLQKGELITALTNDWFAEGTSM